MPYVTIPLVCHLFISLRNCYTGEVDNYPDKIEGEVTDERHAVDIVFLNDMKHYFAVAPLA